MGSHWTKAEQRVHDALRKEILEIVEERCTSYSLDDESDRKAVATIVSIALGDSGWRKVTR